MRIKMQSVLVLAALASGCLRLVVTAPGTADAGPPGVRIDRVGILAQRMGLDPQFLSPDAGPMELGVYAGDALVIDGEHWDPNVVEVSVGSLSVAVEDVSTATRLQVRLATQRVEGAVVVKMPGSAAQSRETVRFLGAGKLGGLQDRGTVEPQLAIVAAGAMHGCVAAGPAYPTGAEPPVPTDAVFTPPSCMDVRHEGLAVVFNLGLTLDPTRQAYAATLSNAGGDTQLNPLPDYAGATGTILRS